MRLIIKYIRGKSFEIRQSVWEYQYVTIIIVDKGIELLVLFLFVFWLEL